VVDPGAGSSLIGLAPLAVVGDDSSKSFDRSGYYIQPYQGRLYSQLGDVGRPYRNADITAGSILEVPFLFPFFEEASLS
jgi:hypothetical protein